MGQEPRSKAEIFSIARSDFRVTVTGQGSLPRGPDSGEEGGEGGGAISIIPAAVVKQRWVIFAFAAVILGLGFYGLYLASGSAPAAPSKKRKS